MTTDSGLDYGTGAAALFVAGLLWALAGWIEGASTVAVAGLAIASFSLVVMGLIPGDGDE